ncbi:MAG TPA: hypothetical protein VGB18_00505 [Candidatus Thermoplasmatota archaeon]
MRSPAYIASVVAALLALVPAIIRLYESITTTLASASLYLAWLLLWIVTASSLLWTGFGKEGQRPTRIAIGVCGGAMLLALVTTVSAVADAPTTVPALLAVLAHLCVAGGSAACSWLERNKNRLTPASWAVAAVGALVLALASILFLSPQQQAFGRFGLPAGTFLLAVGLSLALGQYGEANATPLPTPAASQEP